MQTIIRIRALKLPISQTVHLFIQNVLCYSNLKCMAMEKNQLLPLPEYKPTTSIYKLQNALQICKRSRDFYSGRIIYSSIVGNSMECSTFLGTHLVQMFASCGSLSEAQKAFDLIFQPNVFTWSAIISAYANAGNPDQAVQLYYKMQCCYDVKPDGHIFAAVLIACACSSSLELAMLIHFSVIEYLSNFDLFVRNGIINTYLKCGSFEDALAVFSDASTRDMATWSTMISGCVDHDQGQRGLQVFVNMLDTGLDPDRVIFISAIRACSRLAALIDGMIIHSYVIEKSIEQDCFVDNIILDMYVKCGGLADAEILFGMMAQNDVVTWNSMISAHSTHEYSYRAFQLLQRMSEKAVLPNQSTLVSTLKCSRSRISLFSARVIHTYVEQSGLNQNTNVAISLINMYATYSSLEDAYKIVCTFPMNDIMVWNAYMNGCTQSGHASKVLEIFFRMIRNNVMQDEISLMTVLKACSSIDSLDHGNSVLHYMTEMEIVMNTDVGNAALDMYIKCGSLSDACWIFTVLKQRSKITWSMMISGFADYKHDIKAFNLFVEMQQENVVPDQVSFVCIIKAMSSLKDIHKGWDIHTYAVEIGCESDLIVKNTLIEMYSKCGSLEDSFRVFDGSLERNEITWNIMISGFMDYGFHLEAHDLYLEMQIVGMKPSQVTYCCLLKGISDASDLYLGYLYHNCIVENSYDNDKFVTNTLIYMYSFCGKLKDANLLFESLQCMDMVSCNAMASGYAIHGCIHDVFTLLQKLLQTYDDPDPVMFVTVLKACSTVGALRQGEMIYSYIIECGYDSNAVVTNTVLDMYTRCGSFDDAHKLSNKLPNRDIFTWGAIINGCAQNDCNNIAWDHLTQMHRTGLEPNEVIFGSLLTMCSQMGLVGQGSNILESMASGSMLPTATHYSCMMDLLGRAGCLKEAEDLLQCVPFNSATLSWVSLLCHSRIHGSTQMGQKVFCCLS